MSGEGPIEIVKETTDMSTAFLDTSAEVIGGESTDSRLLTQKAYDNVAPVVHNPVVESNVDSRIDATRVQNESGSGQVLNKGAQSSISITLDSSIDSSRIVAHSAHEMDGTKGPYSIREQQPSGSNVPAAQIESVLESGADLASAQSTVMLDSTRRFNMTTPDSIGLIDNSITKQR
jgi:hypothetical protein